MQRFACVLVLAALVGCDSNDDRTPACEGNVTTATSTAAGTVDVEGDFAEGQPILDITLPSGNHMLYPATTYDEDTAQFTNIPAGTFSVDWRLSCFEDGQADVTGPTSITVL